MTSESTNSCPYECSKSDVIDQTAEDIQSLKITVDRIDRALQGDEYHPNGLVRQRVKDHRRIVRIERFLWTAGGAVSVGILIFKVLF